MTFRRALSFILASLVFTSGATFSALWYWNQVQKKRGEDPQYTIVALAQSTPSGEPLKSAYLAELLGLSTDQPQNLYAFDAKAARKGLLGSALIKNATITKIKPGTLLIDYELRQPVAFSGDFSNTAIDAEGVLIPFKPFFTPKKLPILALGEQEEESGKWGKPLTSRKSQLALRVFHTLQRAFNGEPIQLLQLDVSRAHALSYGQRELIALVEDKRETGQKLVITPIYLRLSPGNYTQEIANFLKMRPKLPMALSESAPGKVVHNKALLIELRVPQLAFVSSL